MPTHRVHGFVRVGGSPVARRVDVIAAASWGVDGTAAAVVGTTISDPGDGAWSVELDSDDLVYVIAPAVPPYAPLLLGPYRPDPL